MVLSVRCTLQPIDFSAILRPLARIPPVCTIVISLVVLTTFAVFAPCFVGAQQKARTASIRGCMRTIQIAAELYAGEAGGKYPATLSELEPFLPGGSNKVGGMNGQWPRLSWAPGIIPCICNQSLTTSSQMIAMRGQDPHMTKNQPGQVMYSSIDRGASYAVIGIDVYGTQVTGTSGHILVLSNQ